MLAAAKLQSPSTEVVLKLSIQNSWSKITSPTMLPLAQSRALLQYFLRSVSPCPNQVRNISASSDEFIDYFLSGEVRQALYHCNYCKKDISGSVRIKCAECADFDLCLECFSVGAESTPHKNDHKYRVMVCTHLI
jgi:hypothetical protein